MLLEESHPMIPKQLWKVLTITCVILFIGSCEEDSSPIDESPTLLAPSAITSSMSLATSSSATVTGRVNPNGSPTSVWFEYGTTSTLMSYSTSVQESIGAGTSSININQFLTDLSSSTTYHYRIAASNDVGTNRGLIRSLETEVGYNNITGNWDLSTETDFSNNAFTASLTIDMLSLTQTNDLLIPGSSDVYIFTGTFSGMYLSLQRKSDGTFYSVHNNVSGNLFDGGINTGVTSHILSFHLGSSSGYYLRGTAHGYLDMSGDISATVDMTSIFGTSDGVITLTGDWTAIRK